MQFLPLKASWPIEKGKVVKGLLTNDNFLGTVGAFLRQVLDRPL